MDCSLEIDKVSNLAYFFIILPVRERFHGYTGSDDNKSRNRPLSQDGTWR